MNSLIQNTTVIWSPGMNALSIDIGNIYGGSAHEKV